MFKDLLHNLKNRFFGADSRWLDERAIAALTSAVQNGERGHGGELRLVIERRPLPGDTTPQARAERHFATLGLWNTEDRSAVLIYLNLAAHKIAPAIAIGCPFCRVMMTDGLTAEQSNGDAREEVEVVDVANMLLAAVRRGEDTKTVDEGATQTV